MAAMERSPHRKPHPVGNENVPKKWPNIPQEVLSDDNREGTSHHSATTTPPRASKARAPDSFSSPASSARVVRDIEYFFGALFGWIRHFGIA